MGAYGHGENSFDVAAGETDIGSGAANGVLAVLDVEFDWNSGLQSGIGAAIVVHGRVVLVLRSFLCSGRSYAPVVLMLRSFLLQSMVLDIAIRQAFHGLQLDLGFLAAVERGVGENHDRLRSVGQVEFAVES